jgi:hypothetical protein
MVFINNDNLVTRPCVLYVLVWLGRFKNVVLLIVNNFNNHFLYFSLDQHGSPITCEPTAIMNNNATATVPVRSRCLKEIVRSVL